MNYEQLKCLHSKDLTDREIGKIMCKHHQTIRRHLVKIGLQPKREGRKSIEMVGNDQAKCSKCFKIQSLGVFRVQRSGSKYPYRLTYCDTCRTDQKNKSHRQRIDLYLNNVRARIALRSSKLGISCNLSNERLIELFTQQNGLCFYTGMPMHWKNKGLSRSSVSVDKIIPEIGYMNENVVLCTQRANSIKADMTLAEMKEWMPGWYERLVKGGFVK